MSVPPGPLTTRAQAARVIAEVLAGRSLDRSLDATLPSLPEDERPLAQELVYGSVRYFHQLDPLAQRFLAKPFKPKDQEVRGLLLLGLYQLLHTRVPAHAAVAETVAAADGMGKGWAKGVLNAVLRRCQREQPEVRAWLDRTPETRFSHPSWLIEQLQSDWPTEWQNILAANNARPPMSVRINTRRTSRDTYQEQLRAHGLAAAPARPEGGLILSQPLPVTRLPGFAQGLVSVQDAAAQLAAPWLDVRRGHRVLDACAAPGGKLAHILECAPDAEVVALDKDAARLQRVRDTLERLDLRALVREGDAGRPDTWWDRRPFDRILIDAPCSGTGVIRRHPDIKIHRRPTDIAKLREEQGRLLAALWPCLRPGGRLLYATCSVLKNENETVVAAFLVQHPDAREIELDVGIPGRVGRQLLPGTEGMDGFYYACLEKQE